MPRSRLRLTTVFLNAARLSLVVQLVELGFHGGGGGRLAPKGIIKS